jgi:hypothetical protein
MLLTRRRLSFIACAAVAAVLIVLAFRPAVEALSGLSYPYDPDQFRDVGATQAFLDGKGVADPLYRGERVWYNPLLSWVLAGAARVSGGDVRATYMAAGPLINLLAAAIFFSAISVLYGPLPALLTMACYLFWPWFDEPWVTPCLSPWMFPNKLGFSFFCATLLAYWHASRTLRIRAWLIAGFLLGCTFLAHSAPALILGASGLLAVFLPSAPRPPVRWRLKALAALAGTAAVVSLPYLWSIVVTYHVYIVNDAPTGWAWPDLDSDHIRQVLTRAESVSTIPFLAGVWVIVTRFRRDPAARLLVWWLLSAALLFAYGWLQQTQHLVSFVPQYHYFLYITAASMVFIGVGVAAAIGYVAAAAGKWIRWRHAPAAITAILASAAVAVFTVLTYPQFLQRADFNEYRRDAVSISRDLEKSDVVGRILQNTAPGAVILATAEDSLWRVAPTGRYVVGVRPEFSNPFVLFEPREAAQDQMLAAFLARDWRTLNELARPYAVTHVLLNPEGTRAVESKGPLTSGARLLSEKAGYSLYQLESPASSQ